MENETENTTEIENGMGNGGESGAGSGEKKSSYTKGQRIAALTGAILLVGMYLITFVAAVTTSPAAPALFKACLGASMLLPFLFWCYIRFWKLFTDKR